MTNTKQLEWLGSIDDELIISAERAGIKRPARVYLKLIPIAAAMLALITLAVAVLPGMKRPVECELPEFSDKYFEGEGGNFFPAMFLSTEEHISAKKKSSVPVVVGTAENYKTYFLTGNTFDFYVTVFDVRITKVIKNYDVEKNGEIVKCATVFRVTKDGLLAPASSPIPDPEYRIDPKADGEFMYTLSTPRQGTLCFRDHEYDYYGRVYEHDLKDYADYFVPYRFPCGDDYYYYVNGDKVYFDQITE